MRYQPENHRLFKGNRKRLVDHLKASSVVVVNSNDPIITNSDGTLPYHQNSDLFYLTGIEQEETTLMLAPDFPDKKYREVLFIREANEHLTKWEGHKLTREQARERSGIETVMWQSEFANLFNTVMVMGGTEAVYLNTNEHYRAPATLSSKDLRFIRWCKRSYPLHHYERLAPLMHQLRSIKGADEIELLKKAIAITDKAFRRVLGFVKPGVMEYEIEAEYIHEFIRNGSKGFAYSPIVASGANSCVLHYIENNKKCKAGDLVLLDVGAEYGNYNADLTRTIPVNGRYTKRQKDVYNAVLRVQRAAMKMLKPGVHYYEYHKEVEKLIEAELIGLKLFSRKDVGNQDPGNPLFRKYYYHGTSHMLGLDVHDVGSMYEKMKAGMVWTVEPGIYIREEGFGVRIENNVVLTANGCNDLMKNIPVEADEIESQMN